MMVPALLLYRVMHVQNVSIIKHCWTVDMSCVWRAGPASLQGDAGTHVSISMLDCEHALSVESCTLFSTDMMVQILALLNIV